MRSKVLIFGHRGAAEYEDENTLASFEKAIELKADGVELDVRLTKDRKVAVIHDAKVNRTTDKKGYVEDYTLEELGRMGVPSLQNVFDLMKGTGITILIEIKDEGMENVLVKLIRENEMENQVVIISFIIESIIKIKKMINIRTGYSQAKPLSNLSKLLDGAIEAKADFILPRYGLVTKSFVEHARINGLKIITWTVNYKLIAKSLISRGVYGIITNKPDLLD